MVEVGRPRQLGHGDLAGVDEVFINLIALGFRAHAQHPVLGVERDVLLRFEVVGHQRRLTDAQVHERAGLDVLRHQAGQVVAAQRFVGRLNAGAAVGLDAHLRPPSQCC
ncbi:hypothetical protein D9M72_607690 [compost metagenome]